MLSQAVLFCISKRSLSILFTQVNRLGWMSRIGRLGVKGIMIIQLLSSNVQNAFVFAAFGTSDPNELLFLLLLSKSLVFQISCEDRRLDPQTSPEVRPLTPILKRYDRRILED